MDSLVFIIKGDTVKPPARYAWLYIDVNLNPRMNDGINGSSYYKW